MSYSELIQVLVIVIDDSIFAVRYVSLHDPPDGLDAAQISEHLTPQTAPELAAILQSGPLPAALPRTG